MAKNIEMNIKTESGYEVLYPSVMAENIIIENTTYGNELNQVLSNIIDSIDGLIKSKAYVYSGQARGGGKIFNLSVPITNGRILLVTANTFVFLCIYNKTLPIGFYQSESVSSWSQSCSWSATSINFSYGHNNGSAYTGWHHYTAIGIN